MSYILTRLSSVSRFTSSKGLSLTCSWLFDKSTIKIIPRMGISCVELLRQYCSHSLFSPSTFSWEDVGTRLPLFCFINERRLRMDPIKLAITDLNELILRRKRRQSSKKRRLLSQTDKQLYGRLECVLKQL